MAQLEKKTIEGQVYEFSKFGAKQALRMLTRLTKIVGEPLAIAASAAKGDGEFLDRKVDPQVIGKAVHALVTKLDENEVIDICEELAANGVLCNGKQIIFDKHYENLGLLFKVLQAGLEVQYGNFLEEFLGKLPGKMVDTSQEKQT